MQCGISIVLVLTSSYYAFLGIAFMTLNLVVKYRHFLVF